MSTNHFRENNARQLEAGSLYQRLPHDPSVPPLFVVASGNGRWFDGRMFFRDASDIFAVEMITAGESEFEQDGSAYTVKPGQVYLLRPGCRHRYGPRKGGFLHKRYAMIDGILLEPLLRAAGLARINVVRPRSPALIANLLKTIVATHRRRGEGFAYELSALAFRLIVELGRSRAQQFPETVQKAVEYIDQHLNAPVDSGRLAALTGLSLTHFNRLFKSRVGMSPRAFIIHQRMTWARHLLKNSMLSVKEIASVVGFNDPLYFSSRFSRYAGVSPKRYRGGETVK